MTHQLLTIALFAIVAGCVMFQVAIDLKEKFIDASSTVRGHRETLFPYASYTCSPACCLQKNTGLSCDRGCVCLPS